MRTRHLVSLLPWSLLLVALLSGASLAQSPPPDPEKATQAEGLFREGRALVAAGKLAEGCASFERSNQIIPRISTLANLADCRDQNQQIATALALFTQVAEQVRGATDPAGKALLAEAQARIAKLSARVSKLVLRVSEGEAPAGMEILRNGEILEPARWRDEQLLDGGTYQLMARAPGHQPWSTDVVLRAEGDSQTVAVPPLSPERVSAPVSTDRVNEPRPSARRRSLAWPIGLAASAVALGAVAVGVDITAQGLQDDAEAEQQRGRTSEAIDLNDRANSRRDLAQGLGVAAGVCLGAAVYTYLFVGKSSSTTTTASARRAVTPLVGYGVAGMQLQGAW